LEAERVERLAVNDLNLHIKLYENEIFFDSGCHIFPWFE